MPGYDSSLVPLPAPPSAELSFIVAREGRAGTRSDLENGVQLSEVRNLHLDVVAAGLRRV